MKLASFQQRIQELKTAPPSKVKSQRGELIGMFLEKLNEGRIGTKYPPIKVGRLAVMLAPIKSTSDLRAFYGECSQAKNFSSYFFWKYKVAKNQ
jgi:hypothetical protein